MILPLIAYQFVPLSFAELWITSLLTLHTEAAGHSGIRAELSHQLLTPLLKPLGMELLVEDHDIHHRKPHSEPITFPNLTYVVM